MKKLILVLGLSALCLPTAASAHFNLKAPPPTSAGTDGGKGVPPCGDNPDPGTATPAQGGHPLTIMIDETVQHTGFYRFALAINSLSELPLDNVVKDASGSILPPNGMPKGTSASAAYEDPAVFPVLADHMFQHTATTGTVSFNGTILLPNVNCASCTLQVIEFMQGHPFNTLASGAVGGGYFYHHCANLKITADSSLPLFDPTAGGASAGGASSTGGSAGAPSSAGGAGGAVSSAGGQTSSAGASNGTSGASSGGASNGSSGASNTSAGASSGGASNGSSGASSSGATSAGTSGDPAMAADNSGCSCALSKGRSGSRPWLSLLLGLLVVGRRWRRRVGGLSSV
jgi:hypothetical protein